MKRAIFIGIILISIIKISLGQYCYPTTTNLHASHQIQYFQIGDFINITPDTNIREYTDFSDSLMIYVDVGQTYDMVMSKGPNPWAFMAGNTLGYSIWIDFNRDTLFAEDEMIYGEYYSGSIYTYTGTLLLTDNSLNGVYRLRLRNEWGAQPDSPCDALWGGETEDYAITISGNNPDPEIPIGSEGIFILAIFIVGRIIINKTRLD